jgi:D-alanyl-lipoteichoic acid acyltransferase DltB (MBOAT superfamily)
MNFATPLYFYFLILVATIFYFISLIKNNLLIKINLPVLFLLAMSYLFYSTWSGNLLFLIIFTSFIDYKLAIFMDRSEPKYRRFFLVGSFCLNLSVLFFFKYSSFFVKEVLLLFGLDLGSRFPFLEQVVLPAGISFYTFQSMGYIFEVYQGKLTPEKNFFRYALFLAFFPQLVAGPIVLAEYFLPQLSHLGGNLFSQLEFRRILGYLGMGFLKKAILADRLAPLCDATFSEPQLFSSSALLIGALSYSLQIYGDFSGYTDIARGSALIFGINLPENFRMPYLAISFSDFWKRWHITLSTWLKDFLYIPLGGNRKGKIRTYINLIITMLLGGLWHGANWTFLFWGLVHGLLLALEKILSIDHFLTLPVPTTGYNCQKLVNFTLKFIYRFFVVCSVIALWIFFRSPNIEKALLYLGRILSWKEGTGLDYSSMNLFFILLLATISFHWIGVRYSEKMEAWFRDSIRWYDLLLFSFLGMLALLFSKETRPFIYFVF